MLRMSSRAPALLGGASVIMLLSLVSCAQPPAPHRATLPTPETAPALYQAPLEAETRFRVGDRIMVRSYYDPQFNQDLLVRPDGKVSLLLLGELRAAGMTPAELRDLLLRQYGKVANSPDITVSLAESADLEVFLGGEVRQPSVHQLRGSLTVLQAITMAGGLLPSANAKQVLLIRRDETGAQDVFEIDLDRVLTNEMPDPYIRRHDLIFVPRTAIANANRWVDQHIDGIVPDSVLFSFGWVRQSAEFSR